ncbi:MAG: transglutaminase domain-containing protein [Verrucomicrobiales bacterium]|nr:transglutaminase domain-containing protein [Verrucomicrobiales bacterium]
MMLSPWIVALGLAFWGWETGLLPLALVMAVLIVGTRLLPRRFDLTSTEFHRALDLCWALGVGGFLLVYSRESVGNVLREFVQWLPAATFPGLLAQVWSQPGQVPTTALLPFPRWRRRQGEANPWVDLAPPYVAVSLLSASAAGVGHVGFYAGLVLVLGLALWTRRARGSPPWLVGSLLAVAVAGGMGISWALAGLQPWIESRVLEWTSRLDRDRTASRVSRTAIGQKGWVGGSSRVVLTYRDEGPKPMPRQLHVASFTEWFDGSWYASRSSFEKIEGLTDEWVLDARPGRAGAVSIELARGRTTGLLPLPPGTRVIRDLAANWVERTRLGAVRADLRAGVISYRAEHAAHADWEGEPTDKDREEIAPTEREVIVALAQELGLAGRSETEVMERIDRFFRTQFKYSLELVDATIGDPRVTTPLGRFLLGHRTGHCEYFATAATLLLRAVGIPARYATGYSLGPRQSAEGVATVRDSDAHAWVRVWVDGEWRDFDPTPPSDFGSETRSGDWASALGRRWNEWRFQMARWWWLGEKRLLRQAYWLVVPLIAGLVWRFRRIRAALRRDDAPSGGLVRDDWPGLDSDWYAVEEELATRGWARREREPMAEWSQRLAAAGWSPEEVGAATQGLGLHQQLRFDPRGLPVTDRGILRDLAGRLRDLAVRRTEATRL